MESNTDKAMRDKLQGLEMPFDPAAWEQMEAMLDKKDRRRGLFWWWFGSGMAALLLLTVAGTYIVTNSEIVSNAPVAEAHTLVSSTQGNEEGKSLGSNQLNKVGNENGDAVSSTQLNKVGHEMSASTNEAARLHENYSSTDNAGKAPSTNKRSRTKKQGIRGSSGAATALNATKKQRNIQSAENSTVLTRNQQPATRNGQAPTGNSALLTDFNGKSINVNALATSTEPINADKYWLTHLNPADEEYYPARNESSDELPNKTRSKMFLYSVGALGNISTSMVKKSTGGGNGVSFSGMPSSMGGLTHDFLFAGRFAISNSILYAQTQFTVSNVRSQSFAPAPLSFNCKITEVAIPIGIKIYPVAKPNFRFYLSAGVINHIKLSETFSYTAPKQDTVIPNYALEVKNTYPTQTSFDGAGNGVIETVDATAGLASNTSTRVTVNSNDFSLNNTKRYYTSFYAGAGVEGIIKNKWILFAEPSFNMSLQKIGIQERRKYNIGANMGCRYQF